MTNIALLIPSTTKGKNWKNIEDSFFYKIFIPSFIKIINDKYTYKIFLGYDQDDTLLRRLENHEICKDLLKNDNAQIEFIKLNVEKGHLSKMWNILFKKAYDDNYDYFYQCGDDITFINLDWTKQSISNLRNHNNVGLTGPLDYGRIRSNPRLCLPGGERFIQTQTFVSRKHMDTFGFFFPPEIKNWFCDDWITNVYYPTFFYPMRNNFIINQGGNPRYNPSGSLYPNDPVKKLCEELVNKHKLLLTK